MDYAPAQQANIYRLSLLHDINYLTIEVAMCTILSPQSVIPDFSTSTFLPPFCFVFFFRFLLTEYTWQACTKILTTARIRIKSSIVRTIMDILTTFQSYRPMPSSYLLVYFSYFCNATFESIRWILWSFIYKFSVWLTQTCHSSKYPESNCIMQFNVFALK